MTYHQAFDRLGNPIYRRSRRYLGRRIAQGVGFTACIILLALLYGMR